MIISSLIFLQAVAAPPDISINARVRARSVVIEQRGETRLTLTTRPDGGNVVNVRAPDAGGRTTLENVDVIVRADARIADPASSEIIREPVETPPRR